MATIDFLAPVKDLAALANRDQDLLSGYFWMEGRAAPAQPVVGSSLTGGSLVLRGNATETPGTIEARGLFLDEATERLGLGTAAPAERLHVVGPLAIDILSDERGCAWVVDDLTPDAGLTGAIGYLLVQLRSTGAFYRIPVLSHNGSALELATATGTFGAQLVWNVTPASSNPGDAFTRGTYPTSLFSGTSTTGHTWSPVKDGAFSAISDGSGGGYAYQTSGSWICGCTLSGQAADGTVECTFPTLYAGNVGNGLLLRYDATADTGYVLQAMVSNAQWYLRGYDFTNHSTVASTEYWINQTPAAGDRVKVVMTGNTFVISIKPSGGSYSEKLNQAVTAVNTTSALHGLAGTWNTGRGDVRYDDFQFTP